MTKNGLQPLDKGNLSQRVYSQIRAAMMEGSYEPGERLRISGLAKELGVSITPVREAIFRLVSDRALEMKAATAIHVPELSAEELQEIQIIRVLLEGEAAASAAKRITEQEIERLVSIQADFRRAAASDPQQASYFNRQFHFGVIAAARQPMVFSVVENMWVLMGPLLRVFHKTVPKRDLTSAGHKHYDLLDALRERNPKQARAALQDDIKWGQVMVDWAEQRDAEKVSA